MLSQVTRYVFSKYLRACGYVFWPGVIAWWLLFVCTSAVTNIWLSMWSNDVPTGNVTVDNNLSDLRLGVYGGLGVIQGKQ